MSASGGGGTQTAGGAASGAAAAGTFGNGGAAGGGFVAGAGGGGWYGGGGGLNSAGGGGGSGHGPLGTVFETGVRSGDGLVTITYTLQRQLDVTNAGTGTGSVTSDPSGISCGADCNQAYEDGTSVALTAHAASNSFFAGFSGGGCSGPGLTCTVTMDQARSVTATFTRNRYPLEVNTTGTGSGYVSSSPPGIDCGRGTGSSHVDCFDEYLESEQVTLTATPQAGSTFAGWTGSGCSGSGSCQVTMSEARTVGAQFADVDDPPTAVDDSKILAEDAAATTVDVLANDHDADGGPRSITGATPSSHGLVQVRGDGSDLSYLPDPNYCGSDVFSYAINGGSSANVAITVQCVDDLPGARDDAAGVLENSGVTQIDVLANDVDIDGGPIVVSSLTQPAHGIAGIANGSERVVYQPSPDYCGPDSFTYALNGGSTAAVLVSVACADDPSPPGAPGGTGCEEARREQELAGTTVAKLRAKVKRAKSGAARKSAKAKLKKAKKRLGEANAAVEAAC